MFIADEWQDYEVIDTGEGDKIERWGKYTLRRPDPQVIWPFAREENTALPQARYVRSETGGGRWSGRERLPESWKIRYKDYTFLVRPTGFKHTGLFPEQAANWDWMADKIQNAKRPVSILNLFAYTGGATVACAKAGASVCHVDAAKGMVQWAKENAQLSGLSEAPIRYIVDDVLKFVQREIRRGHTYDGIVMDPPSYGRGPDGQVWKLETEIYPLLKTCMQVLSDQPLFFVLNAYTTGLQPAVLRNLVQKTVAEKFGGIINSQELGLPVTKGQVVLPCGATCRWEKNEDGQYTV